MRFFAILIFASVLSALSLFASADNDEKPPIYHQVVDQLTSEQYMPLLDVWLEQQSFTEQELAVIGAIKAYKKREFEAGLEMLEPTHLQGNLPEAHYWAGRIYGQQASAASVFKAGGLAESALESFQRSVDIDPKFIEGYKALVQYYIRAPFFAGGSVKKAQQTANIIATIDPIEGVLARIQIAASEDDSKTLMQQTNELATLLNSELEANTSANDKGEIAGYFFTIAMTQMQAEDYASSRENLAKALGLTQHINEQTAGTTGDKEISILQQMKLSNLRNLQQSIRYQSGRLGVLSKQDVSLSIEALTAFLNGPEHPSYEPHWAKLRLAQLLQLDGQITTAKEFVEQLPDVDNDRFTSLKKKLAKQLR